MMRRSQTQGKRLMYPFLSYLSAGDCCLRACAVKHACLFAGWILVVRLYARFLTCRGHAHELVECIRLLLLPWESFTALSERVRAWRPSTPRDPADRPAKRRKAQDRRKSQQADAGAGKCGGSVAAVAGEVDAAAAARVCRVLCCVAAYMMSRYTCSLEHDEALLERHAAVVKGASSSGKDGSGGSGSGSLLAPRLLSAVVARSAEKRCLRAALLDVWNGQAGQQQARERVGVSLQHCWASPRPGMYGLPGVGDGDDDDDDDEEDEADGDTGDMPDDQAAEGGGSGELLEDKKKAAGAKAAKPSKQFTTVAFEFGFKL